jgi:2'-5' RNA ligase
LFNFFVAFPLEDKNFFFLIKQLKQINNQSFSLQNPYSAHITLRFFGQIDLEKLHQIISKSSHLKGSNQPVNFDNL